MPKLLPKAMRSEVRGLVVIVWSFSSHVNMNYPECGPLTQNLGFVSVL